jgi:polysaccharide export outer membrane protein
VDKYRQSRSPYGENRMKKLAAFRILAIAAVAVSLSSCTATPQNNPVAAQDPAAAAPYASSKAADSTTASLYSGSDTAHPAQIDSPATPVGSLGPAVDAATEYRIAPRDILQISVFQVPDLNNAVQVSEDGTVTLPLVGKVALSGRTVYEAEQILTAALRKYLQAPQVSVAVKTYGKRITISGEVRSSRVLSDDGSTSLSEAIANAGGLSDLANPSRIHIASSINGHVQDRIYNLDDIQAGKTKDPLLKGGDIVVAEASGVRVALKDVGGLLPFAVLAALF